MKTILDKTTTAALWAELRSVVGQLGEDGGQMSPSVYETAQVLRLYPQAVDVEGVVRWLLAQQEPDNGWAGTGSQLYREAPTLAAVLALHQFGRTDAVRHAAYQGAEFLRRRAHLLRGPIPATIPVGFELIWPRLVIAGQEAGLSLPQEEYAAIFALGERKRKQIAQLNPGANTPAIFSWEAWGEHPEPQLVDEEGGVGNSGAATAAWLRAADNNPALATARARAERYLSRAAMSTPQKIPGVMPAAWPMELFERSFVLHALLMADLLGDEALRNVVQPQVEALYQAVDGTGIGFSRQFLPDGDDTAAALAVLAAFGYPVNPTILAPFAHETHFSTYPYEFHASPVITAKAVHALRMCGIESAGWYDAIVNTQREDGLWDSDKWNSSRLYSSAIALMALRNTLCWAAQQRCRKALLKTQRRCGGWGCGATATMIETAFALLGLYILACDDILGDAGWRALRRGHAALLRRWHRSGMADERVWICKDLYSPRRVDRAYVLAALLAPLSLVPTRATHHFLPAVTHAKCAG